MNKVLLNRGLAQPSAGAPTAFPAHAVLLVLGICSALGVSLAFAAAAFGASYERVGAFSGPGTDDGRLIAPGQGVVRQSDGKLFVADNGNGRVEVFTPTASGADFDQSITDASITAPTGIAIDQETGAVYVSDSNGITKLSSDLTVDAGWTDPGVHGPLAFDQHDDRLLVADADVVRSYSPTGTTGATFDGTDGSTQFTELLDIATDSTGDVLLVDATGSRSDLTLGLASSSVLRFSESGSYKATVGSPAAPVAVAVQPGTDDVVVAGNVADSYNIGAPLELSVFAPDGAAGETVSLPTDNGLIYSQLKAVAAASGPAARLYAITDVDAPSGFYGAVSVQVYSVPLPPAPPTIQRTFAAPTYSEADLAARINPERASTTYHFDYGLTDAYGASTAARTIPAGDLAVDVKAHVFGLAPGLTYHVRVVVSNSAGNVTGPDNEFATLPEPSSDSCPNAAVREQQQVTALSGCRAFEMVTPPDKNGNDMMQGENSVLSSVDGDAAITTSLGALSDTESSPSPAQYRSSRDASGRWTTAGIMPPVTGGNGLVGSTYRNFSDDLSVGVLEALNPPLTDGDQPDTKRLYLRHLLGAREYTRVTPPQANVDQNKFPIFAAASKDYSHVLFESPLALTPDAPDGAEANLYEWANGQVRLVGIRPDNSVAIAGSIAGGPADGRYPPGGATGGFYTESAISRDGSRIVWTDLGTQQVYVRTGGTSTVQASASQRSTPEAAQAASFMWATPDGRYVFFKSKELLTDEATRPHSDAENVYRYDVSTDTLVTLTAHEGAGANVAFIGASHDGRSAYFTAALDDGHSVFVWHEGDVRHIADLNDSVDDRRNAPTEPPLTGSKYSRVSADGSKLLLVSTKQLTDYDNAGHLQVYLYDRYSDRLACASCSPRAAASGGDATPVFGVPGLVSTMGPLLRRSMTPDGKRVFFDTSEALVPEDTNGRVDVYVYEDGVARLISSGKGASDAHFSDASVSGDDVLFSTSAQLVPEDVDANIDIYDARVDGGQIRRPSADPPCADDRCQGPLSVPSTPPIAGSVTFNGLEETIGQPSARPSTTAKPKVSKPKSVRGSVAVLRVKVPARGAVTVSGTGLKKAKKTATKASTVSIRVSLTARAAAALTKKKTLRATARVTFTPIVSASSTARVSLTFIAKKASRAGTSARSTAKGRA